MNTSESEQSDEILTQPNHEELNSSDSELETNDPFADYRQIQYWSSIKSQIQKTLANNKQDPSTETRHHQAQTLSHGFQSVRVMDHHRDIISVLYLPNTSLFIALDEEYLHLWRNGIKFQKIRAQANNSIVDQQHKKSVKHPVDGLYNISRMIYIESFRIYIVANRQLEMKVLDLQYLTLSVYSCPKPILCIEYSKLTNTIVCGEIGSIRLFRVLKSDSFRQTAYQLQEIKEIQEGLEDLWITCLFIDSNDRIYAGAGESLFVFSVDTGENIDVYENIHELSITSIVLYEPTNILITGSKDGSIKIWARKSLLHHFHDHFHAITGFILMETICDADKGTLPLLISSSLDSTIRMMNFESLQMVYRIDTVGPCLGIKMIKKNHFYHFTSHSIQVWNVNQYQHTFSLLRSRPKSIEIVKHLYKPKRVISTVQDGSIRLISPITGTILSTGFPIDKDFQVKQVAYDRDAELIYSLNTNGTIVQYSSEFNPFKIKFLWDSSRCVSREVTTCICGGDFYNYRQGYNLENDKRILQRKKNVPVSFVLFGGTVSGQIHQILFNGKDYQTFLIQAHTTAIEQLKFDSDNAILISGGKGI
jgi:WD40 repeat protein